MIFNRKKNNHENPFKSLLPVFRKLNSEELKMLVNWAAKEGWNPGPKDADVYYSTDPDGHYGYFIDDELIAGGSIVSYGGDFGFMGLFIVKPAYRGSGFGRKLWLQRRELLLSRLKPGAAIGMDGVVAMQPFYKNGGFHFAFRDERHERVGQKFEIHSNVVPFQNTDFKAIADLDFACLGYHRDNFLQAWLQLPGNFSFCFREKNQLKAYVVMRKAETGYKIGPLLAETVESAEALYIACLNTVPGESVFLDIPSVNVEAVKLTMKYNTRLIFECARMYFGNPPTQQINHIFGITSFELG